MSIITFWIYCDTYVYYNSIISIMTFRTIMTLITLREPLWHIITKGKHWKKTIITLQALRFKLNCLNQTCISLKSIMQLTKTIFPDSAIFIEKKRVENRLWRKSEFSWRKKNMSYRVPALSFPSLTESFRLEASWLARRACGFDATRLLRVCGTVAVRVSGPYQRDSD